MRLALVVCVVACVGACWRKRGSAVVVGRVHDEHCRHVDWNDGFVQ